MHPFPDSRKFDITRVQFLSNNPQTDLPWHEFVAIDTQLEQSEQNGRHVEIGLPDGESAPDQVDGGAAERRERRQTLRWRRQQQERQRLA